MIFKAPKGEISNVSAFAIWNILRSRYVSVTSVQLYIPLIHDRDFALLLGRHLTDLRDQANTLEKMCGDFKIKVPSGPPVDYSSTPTIPQLTDVIIYRITLEELTTELFAMGRMIPTIIVDDHIRDVLVDFFLRHLQFLDAYYKYGKLKGWMDIVPSHITGEPTEHEQISLGEANHLWDHLNQRYDQITLTEMFLHFTHDKDFQLILQQGLSILREQVKDLEKLAVKYIIPLPNRPTAQMPVTVDPEVVTDRIVYRQILQGLRTTLMMHFTAAIESITSDGLRDLFTALLKKEIELYGRLVKYGKVKGWTHIPPMYLNKA